MLITLKVLDQTDIRRLWFARLRNASPYHPRALQILHCSDTAMVFFLFFFRKKSASDGLVCVLKLYSRHQGKFGLKYKPGEDYQRTLTPAGVFTKEK